MAALPNYHYPPRLPPLHHPNDTNSFRVPFNYPPTLLYARLPTPSHHQSPPRKNLIFFISFSFSAASVWLVCFGFFVETVWDSLFTWFPFLWHPFLASAFLVVSPPRPPSRHHATPRLFDSSRTPSPALAFAHFVGKSCRPCIFRRLLATRSPFAHLHPLALRWAFTPSLALFAPLRHRYFSTLPTRSGIVPPPLPSTRIFRPSSSSPAHLRPQIPRPNTHRHHD